MPARQLSLFSPKEIYLANTKQTIQLWVNKKEYKKFLKLKTNTVSGTYQRRAGACIQLFDLDLVSIHRATLDGCVHLQRRIRK